ncbi:acylphosphatase [Rhodobacterales bacterium HKCCE3408]|nr:acylphosphatase [Rhodobacterales bacterium HKCCE3408]
MFEDRETKSVTVSVSGRVQGVGYRAWVHRSATRLKLSGWVRNESDGTVSALLDGAPENVDQLLKEMESGPPAARVDRVSSLPAAGAPDPGFEITFPDE